MPVTPEPCSRISQHYLGHQRGGSAVCAWPAWSAVHPLLCLCMSSFCPFRVDTYLPHHWLANWLPYTKDKDWRDRQTPPDGQVVGLVSKGAHLWAAPRQVLSAAPSPHPPHQHMKSLCRALNCLQLLYTVQTYQQHHAPSRLHLWKWLSRQECWAGCTHQGQGRGRSLLSPGSSLWVSQRSYPLQDLLQHPHSPKSLDEDEGHVDD